MNKRTKKNLQSFISLILLGYLGVYFHLRFNGFISHYENRGTETGHWVKARISE
jgi:hypothetical protein